MIINYNSVIMILYCNFMQYNNLFIILNIIIFLFISPLLYFPIVVSDKEGRLLFTSFKEAEKKENKLLIAEHTLKY